MSRKVHREQRWPECSGDKACYESEASAWRCAVKAMKFRGRKLRVYFCKQCRAWHMTKQAEVNYEVVR